VTCYYFYLWDDDFGPAFIKICAYFPYPAKIWINGHEWAKRQATHAGIGFTELSNGFAATDDPAGLQAICDRLGPATIEAFAERWLAVLPLPLTPHDQAGGYWWEISMRQVEVSRTIVFAQPRHARGFFEALVADNLDIGRPEQVELIFAGRRVGPAATGHPGGLQDQGRHPRGRRHRERLLPALPNQAVPQRRARAAYRDRHQRHLRPGLPTPPAQPARTADQGPCGQPSPARY
jgi:hypothetical protein